MPEAVRAARGSSVPEAFGAVVARHGGRCALEAGETRLTYEELDRRSNRVAHALLADDRAEPLAMIAPLAPESVIVMLGALKAGRLFAPLDPRDPPGQTRRAVEHLGARLILGIDELDGGRDDDPGVVVSPDHPAVVYFSSGSTGRASALLRDHGFLSYPTDGHGITALDRVASILPLAFAGSISNVFGPLFGGGTACFFDPITRSIGDLAEWIEACGITFFQTSPSTLEAVAGALAASGRTAPLVRLVVIGGEPCEGKQLEQARLMLPRATIANHYGSTEASFIAVTRIAPGELIDPGPIPFRQLYPDQTITIVDESGLEVRRGEVGEIRVCSRNVSPGYYGEPPVDARKFVQEGQGRRSIQLKDRARLHADGRLELLGRNDLRVNVNGQSVNLEAVEQALAALPDVEGAVVSAVTSSAGRTRLVAHVVGPRNRLRSRDLRLGLSRTLPPFAIPATFVLIAEIPRTARGKIDRALLSASASNGSRAEADYVAPRSEREREIAELVAAALGVTQIGVRDDIFELGADSLTIVGMIEAISDLTGVSVSAADLLAAPTVEQLAALSERDEGATSRVVIPVHTEGSGPPIFCVPAAGGGGMLSTRRLGLRLGRPTFSFQWHGFDRRAVPDRSVPRAAARYVAALRDIQSEGPYVIGGMSFGGLVAFEMAKQLEAGGERVALLILVEPVTRSRARFVESVRRVNAGQGLFITRMARYIKRLLVDRYRANTAGIIRRPHRPQAKAFLSLSGMMARGYWPTGYAGPTLLLRTQEWKRYDDHDIARFLVGHTIIRAIPGSHMTIFTEPNLTAVADIIRSEIQASLPIP